MNPNVLRQYLEMFDQQGLGTPRYSESNPAYVSQLGAVPIQANRGRERMQWATRMASMGDTEGQPAPDFFGGDGGGGQNRLAAYVRPERIADDRFIPARGQPRQDPQRPRVNNYLAGLLQQQRGGARYGG